MIALYRKNTLPIQVSFPVCSILFMGQMISPSHPYLLLKAPCLGWRRLSGDRTVVNFTMWSWVGLNVFMLIWRECLVLGDVAASEHGVGWGGGGWGGLITFMSAAGRMWCYGMLRCEDVEVTSGTLWMLRCEDVEVTSGTLWILRCEDVEITSGTKLDLAWIYCRNLENSWNRSTRRSDTGSEQTADVKKLRMCFGNMFSKSIFSKNRVFATAKTTRS